MTLCRNVGRGPALPAPEPTPVPAPTGKPVPLLDLDMGGRGGVDKSFRLGETPEMNGRDKREREEIRCRRCRKLGHIARDCPEPDLCFKCGKEGHKAVDCKEVGLAVTDQWKTLSSSTTDL